MIRIDQEELCKQCDRDPSRCEGNGCDEARASYLEDNGLVEDEPQTFGDLRRNDPVYVIYKNVLTKDRVESVLDNNSGLHISTEKHSSDQVKPNDSVSTDKSWYVQKRHAINAYQDLLNLTIKTMMKNIIDMEADK